MYKELRPEQIDILVGSPAVNDEFSKKIRELDRRLQANGMSYRDWDILNDRQHDIFSNDMFLDGECATSVKDYVMGAVDSCWCPDVVEDLEHHSPVLMREIEKQQDMLPDMTVKIGESLNNLNETIDLLLENIILSEQDEEELPSSRGDLDKYWKNLLLQKIMTNPAFENIQDESDSWRKDIADKMIKDFKQEFTNAQLKALRQDPDKLQSGLRAATAQLEKWLEDNQEEKVSSVGRQLSDYVQKYEELTRIAEDTLRATLRSGNPDLQNAGEMMTDGQPALKATKAGFGNAKSALYTNTFGPQDDRLDLLIAVKDALAAKGSEWGWGEPEVEYAPENFRGFRILWPDQKNFNYAMGISRGGAKGMGNKGDVLEGVLAAALFHRFQDPDADVTIDEVEKTLIQLGRNGEPPDQPVRGEVEADVKGAKPQDTVKMMVGLSPGNFGDLTGLRTDSTDKLNFRGELEKLLSGAVQAVNIQAIQDTAEYLRANEEVDHIEIAAAGMEDQRGTKVDLYVRVRQGDETFPIHTRLDADSTAREVMRKVGSLSLKLGSKLLGSTGSSWDNTTKTDEEGNEVISTYGIAGRIKQLFGVDLNKINPEAKKIWTDEFQKHQNTTGGLKALQEILEKLVMKPVYDHVKPILDEGGKGEDDLLNKIARGVRYTATRSEDLPKDKKDEIGFLRLDPGQEGQLTARYLNWYAKLDEALRRGGEVDLAVTLKEKSDKNATPQLLFYDKNVAGNTPPETQGDPSVMFSFRGKSDSSKATNFRTYVEHGDRLTDLIEDELPAKTVKKIKKQAKKAAESEED